MERIAELIEMLNDGELELLKEYVEKLRTQKRVILEIPYKFPSYNEYIDACRTHNKAGARMKRQIQDDIGYFINRLPVFEAPIRIKFTWIEGNKKRDCDNVSSSRKFILDAMVELGKIKDDGPKYVTGFEDNFEHSNEWKVILEITEEG